MSRLSNELTPEQHPSNEDLRALQELESFLAPRMNEAKASNITHGTAQDIFKSTLFGQ